MISSELESSPMDAAGCMRLCLQVIQLQHGQDEIYAGLKLAVLKYNTQIMKESSLRISASRRELMMQKRDAAREILELLEQN